MIKSCKLSVYGTFLILGSILIIGGVSTILVEESQTKMMPLFLGTEEGRRKDVLAKILAYSHFTDKGIIFRIESCKVLR